MSIASEPVFTMQTLVEHYKISWMALTDVRDPASYVECVMKKQKSIAQVFNLVYWLIYFFHRKMFKMVLDSSGKDYRLLYNVVWICLKVRQILLISMSDGWKADFEINRPTSHCCLAQLPKVQYLGKMVLVQFMVNLHFLYHRKTLN